MSDLIAFESKVVMTIPGVDNIVKATVKSDVREGLTIELPAGASMFKLHDLMSKGQIVEISFAHTSKEYTDEH